MSLSCPKCGTQLDQDFGLVNCPGCATVLSVDVDGQVHVPSETHVTIEYQSEQAASQFENLQSPAEAPQTSQQQEAEQPLEEQLNTETSDNLHDGYATQEPTEEPQSIQLDSLVDNNYQEVEPQPVQSQESQMGISELPPTEEQVNSDYQSIYPEEEEEVLQDPSQSVAQVMQEITDYGNAEGNINPLSYTLIIEGLDFRDAKDTLRDVLQDSKMKWDVEEVMGNIRGGKLVINNLNPAKASILVRRLMPLKLKFTWSQHAYA